MLSDDVREFIILSGKLGKASDSRYKELMGILRRAGLKSPQIVKLSGNKISATIVRQYMPIWGDEDASLVKELNLMMGPLRELMLSNSRIEDVISFTVLKKSIEAKGSSVEAVAELDVHLGNMSMKRGEVTKVVNLSRRLDEKHSTVEAVWEQMDLDEALANEGFAEPQRRKILDMCRKRGGVEKVLEEMSSYVEFVDFKRLADEEVNRAALAAKRADDAEGRASNFEAEINAFTSCLASGWSSHALVNAPKVLKWVDTAEKREALIDHLTQLEWYNIPDGETRLVKIKRVYHNQALMAETLSELRAVCNEEAPRNPNLIVKLTQILMEKLPGLTLADYAHLLYKSPGLSDDERRIAQYLIQVDEAVKRVVDSNESHMLKTENKMWRIQNEGLEEKHRVLRDAYPNLQEQLLLTRLMQLSTGNISAGEDLRVYWGIMGETMRRISEAASKDTKLTYAEKKVMTELCRYSNLLTYVDPMMNSSTLPHIVSLEHRGLRFARVPEQSNPPTRVVNLGGLKKISDETRLKVYRRVLTYTLPPDGEVDGISGLLGVKPDDVKNLINWLITDPTSREDLRIMGFLNYQLPGWVVILPDDKFASLADGDET